MRIVPLSVMVCWWALAAGDVHAQESDCHGARALIVIDKSSSMITEKIGGQTKWQVAREAVGLAADRLENRIELGLMWFPAEDACTPGTVNVQPALGTADDIRDALVSPPPTEGSWTPIEQTLRAAANASAFADTSLARHVVLVTDGWQWCYPYDANTRFDPIDAVEDLVADGIHVHVVGLSESVDTLTLNRMAKAAGTNVIDCDVESETPEPCFYRADAPKELIYALEQVAGDVISGSCDKVCEADVKEACGIDGCGQKTCGDGGQWGECQGGDRRARSELCDGEDNDCDGEVDNQASSSCGAGLVCQGGACVPGGQGGGVSAPASGGCSCNVAPVQGTSTSDMILGGIVLIGLVFALRHVRRK